VPKSRTIERLHCNRCFPEVPSRKWLEFGFAVRQQLDMPKVSRFKNGAAVRPAQKCPEEDRSLDKEKPRPATYAMGRSNNSVVAVAAWS